MKKFLNSFSSAASRSVRPGPGGRPFEPVVKGAVSPMRAVPSSIKYPEYALNGNPRSSPKAIITYDSGQLSYIRKSARLARKMLEFALSLAKPGVTTEDIDIATHHEIISQLLGKH